MSKLIPMEEAAKLLGLSVEKLNDLRSNNEVFGYRDGATWKFKMSELARVADEHGLTLSTPAPETIVNGGSESDSSELDLELEESSLDLFLEPDSDSLELEDSSALIQPPQDAQSGGTSSDILSNDALSEDDDDDDIIDLAESGLLIRNSSKSSLLTSNNNDELSLADSADDLQLEDSAELQLASDSIKLSDDSILDDSSEADLTFGSSSLELASESSKSDSPSATGDDLLDESLPPSGQPSTGRLSADDAGAGSLLARADDLFDDDLDLADSASFESSSFEDSGDLVLDDSESSLELSLEANESGLALGDEPLELGGSEIDDLELPENDDDIILVDNRADSDSATLMEDDFNLTPHEISLDEENESSGSQVIALAESEVYADDSAATVLSGDSFSAQTMESDHISPTAGAMGVGAAVMAGTSMVPETTYSKFELGLLGLSALVLFLGTIVAYGTAQNLWLPDDQVVNSGLMSWFIDALGLN